MGIRIHTISACFLAAASICAAAEPEGRAPWPAGRSVPAFAEPAAKLDALVVQDLGPDELITFSSLQGRVNIRQPRFILLDNRAGEGRDTWLKTPTTGIGEVVVHGAEARFDVIAKYSGELRGVVLYDVSLSEHYRNLAGTVAALENALPVTRETLAAIASHGWDPEIVADLTGLRHESAVDIYQHLRGRYWPHCTKRLIVSARPSARHGDLHHTRDMAAACGAAVVWLDPRERDQRDLLGEFFRDMPAGEAVALGWYATERSGITTASEFGIGTMPADFFNGSTIFAASPGEIRIPPVPRMPELENKVYIAVFISDGDNIQYIQHAMRQAWDGCSGVRGRIPLNWTIAPGLVDIAPGLMNYYYGAASPNDCFVSGPSGMGYLMPVNTLAEPGAPVGVFLKDRDRADGYTRMTGRFTERAGLRVITIWDDATPEQRAAYERNGPLLYGLTVQNFKDVPSVAGSVENKRLRFEKLRIPYAGSYDDLLRDVSRAIRGWDGKSPLFLSYQMNIWGEMKPQRIVEFHNQLQREHPGRTEFVRADHFFNLQNQAERLSYNLCLDPATEVRASGGEAADAVDGTPVTRWSGGAGGESWLGFDFGAARNLRRYVIHHAPADARPSAVAFQVSDTGRNWRTVDVCRDGKDGSIVVTLPPTRVRYARLLVKPGDGASCGLADVEIYGSR